MTRTLKIMLFVSSFKQELYPFYPTTPDHCTERNIYYERLMLVIGWDVNINGV